MRILILGGSGMLGHKLWQLWRERFDTYISWRGGNDRFEKFPIFDIEHVVNYVSAQDFDTVINAVAITKPSVIVNCIGIVKQSGLAKNPIPSISINALFPHRLAQLCQASGIRLIHLSTDCVFSGTKGNYIESDTPNAEDLYGRTKFLGEVNQEGCLTIRTSIIGRELETTQGLVEWFLSKKGKIVKGYQKAIFSGFTTIALTEIITKVIMEFPSLYGVLHVASTPISKYDLLGLIKQVYDVDIAIEPDQGFVCDRSLNAQKFQQFTGIVPPSWPSMISQMCQDPTPYDQIRGHYAH
jgi:dTDP-4-dehydrorhamnose reductase